MKKVKIISLSILTASAVCGCSSARKSPIDLDLVRSELSWATFCATHGYDIDDCTHEAYNLYLDGWCGSAEEEKAFIKAGIEP